MALQGIYSDIYSSSAHWALALAVEVWQCPLRSRGWGAGGRGAGRRRRRRGGLDAPLIKSRDPHLAGVVSAWFCETLAMNERLDTWACPVSSASKLKTLHIPLGFGTLEDSEIWASAFSTNNNNKNRSKNNNHHHNHHNNTYLPLSLVFNHSYWWNPHFRKLLHHEEMW